MSVLAPRAPIRRTLRAMRPVAWLLFALLLIALAIAVFVSIDTNLLWFHSVGDSGDYTRRLWTEIVMFAVFGGGTAAVLAVTTWFATRLTPTAAAAATPSRLRSRWRSSPTARRLVLIIVPLALGLRAGFAAAGKWQLWLLWRNGVSFGAVDPRFHRDYSYYLFSYPLHRYAESVALSAFAIAVAWLLVIGWLRGAWQLRNARPRTSTQLRAAASVLLGLIALIKALAYWLDRFGTVVSSRGVVTGQSYVDLHVVLPMKLALLVIAVLVAAAFFANVWLRRMSPIGGGVLTLIFAGLILGGLVPFIVQTFVVKGDAIAKQATPITRNIQATRFGFDVQGAQVSSTGSAASTGTRNAATTAAGALQPRLMDPNIVSSAFVQLQQRQSYYRFKSTLDVDRYSAGRASRDVVIGVRELNPGNLPGGSQNWTNAHLVYTHGLGVVAAPTTSADAGQPSFIQQGIPSAGSLDSAGANRPVYFGQSSPAYSVVGEPAGRAGIEFDAPGRPANYVDRFGGGVPIGSTWRQLLYALRFTDKNLLFSSDINADSQILYRRSPSARISAVAPWLTLDGDVYPVDAGGRLTWVADGYTTANMLPNSQLFGLRSSTMTTYVKYGSNTAQPTAAINYIRNSVVATVDATTGAVSLYAKPGVGSDPVLQTWEKAFPGLVKPAGAIPSYLLPHLRYPQDLFNLQRAVLARYHVLNPATFYSRSQFWQVPGDPTVAGAVAQPSYYATMTVDGKSQFALTTPLLTLNRSNIAAFLTVGCDYSAGYGQLRLTEIPSSQQTESPGQLQHTIEADPNIAQQLSVERLGQSAIKLGNLQTISVGGQVLAVEPIYEQTRNGSKLPLLRHVAVVYGSNAPGFASTFPAALAQALGITNPNAAPASSLLAQASQLYAEAQAAHTRGDDRAYQRDLTELGQVLARAAGSSG